MGGELMHCACLQVEGAVPESYYFRINGIPLYLKGANVIPMTMLPSNTTQAVIESMLTAAVEANQNLLRVWGGGLYHVSSALKCCRRGLPKYSASKAPLCIA